ncbi:hypothetical protein MRB53_018831 [Persea americana]|uniref:Uncharacterized protein n=1 Tax=Persea americana TaxID=3435 RepID=A0ACC2MAG1_PERAE|nr:hypothetical protein MRB53_018831 [Persea americana]
MVPTRNCSFVTLGLPNLQHRLSPGRQEPAHLDKLNFLPLPFLSQASNIENPRNRCRKDPSLSLPPQTTQSFTSHLPVPAVKKGQCTLPIYSSHSSSRPIHAVVAIDLSHLRNCIFGLISPTFCRL